MLDLLLPHERDVVVVEGDVQAKLRKESEALGIGRHPRKARSGEGKKETLQSILFQPETALSFY
jgi:hypothetical protein